MLEVDDTRQPGPRGEQWVLTWRGPTPLRVLRVVGSVYLVLVREEDAPWPPPGALRTLRLQLELDDGGTLPVFDTLVRRDTGFVLEAHGLPMAVDLARALGVPWCWRELP